MYCKKCGKLITDDSMFCKYCGALEEDSIEINNYDKFSKIKSEIITSDSNESPIKIEITKNPTIKKSTIANEIVANIKMLGIAFALWLVYIIGFSVFHLKNIRPHEYSVTEPTTLLRLSLVENPEDWEKQYARNIILETKSERWREYLNKINDMSAKEALNYANDIAKAYNLKKELLESLKEEAKKTYWDAKKTYWNTIKNAYKKDLHNNMAWAAIIALSLTILGRYIIKFIIWVANNKTNTTYVI